MAGRPVWYAEGCYALIDQSDHDWRDASANHAQLPCGPLGQINDPSLDEGASIIDQHFNFLPGVGSCHQYLASQREARVSGCQRLLVEGLSACSGRSLKAITVKRGNALLCFCFMCKSTIGSAAEDKRC